MSNLKAPTPTVLEIGQLGFEGHIIPRAWYQTITRKTPKGKVIADILAINVLSEIIYWYRPKTVVDEVTGKIVGVYRKFASDKLQRSYQAIADYFGVSKRQAADACKRLRDTGLVTLELRTFTTKTGIKMVNVLYIEPVPSAIKAATYPPELTQGSYEKTGEVLQENGGDSTEKAGTNTDTSSENSGIDSSEKKPSELDAFFGPRPEDNGDSPEQKAKQRIRAALDTYYEENAGKPPMSVPADAGGADDWVEPVNAFAKLIGIAPGLLPGSDRKEWRRVLEKLGTRWGAGPAEVQAAVEAIPDSEFHWKTYSKPHQAVDDLGALIGQARSGNLKPRNGDKRKGPDNVKVEKLPDGHTHTTVAGRL